MSQERRATRHQICLFVGSGDEGLAFGRTRDLSRSGIFLETKARPPLGSVHRISFVWGEDTVFCDAEVARHADNGVGLRFLDAETAFINAVEEIIGSSQPVDLVPAPGSAGD